MVRDAYEQQYMDSGPVVYREKHVARIFTGIFLVLALAVAALGVFITATALAHGAGVASLVGLSPFVTAGIIALVGLYFAVMRTTVSPTHLSVTWGTLGKKVPLAGITSARLEDRVGLGPKYDGKGWNYGPLGTSRGVRVEWSHGGKAHSCYVGSTDPEALMRAIQEGRLAQGHAECRKRIDVDPSASTNDAEAEAAAEAEEEALAGSERRQHS